MTTPLSVTTADVTSLLPDHTTHQVTEYSPKVKPTVGLECPEPPSVDYAEVVVTTRFPGDPAVYTCHHGYQFDTGGVTRVSVCQDSLQWSPVPNECTTDNCPALPTRAHMKLSTNSTDVGTMVRADCHVGYRFVDGTDTKHIMCVSPGKWNRQLGECLYKYCTAVPYVDNARQTMAYLVRPLLSCYEGHYFSGGVSSKLLRCVNGLWSTGSTKHYGNCESSRCPLPRTPRNGTVYLATNDTLYGAIAIAACREGLWFADHRRASITLRCSENGTWNATDLVCTDVVCTFERRTVGYNEVISYSCPQGLRMRDGYERKSFLCGSEGELNDTISDCGANRCHPIPIVQNAMPNTTLATDGSTVVYTCNPGFSFSAGILENGITCQNQSWNHVSDCQPVVCPRKPPIQFATFGDADGEYQSTLTVTCDLGYTVDGDKSTSVLICGNSSQWEPNITQCDVRKCFDPPVVENATQQGSTVAFLETVNYTCLPGYTLPGNQREQAAVCQHDGTWSHVINGCGVVTCLPIAVWTGMEINTTETTRGTILNVSCQNGELLVNRRPWLRTTCRESGDWDPPIPECTKPPEEEKFEPQPEEAEGAQYYGTVAGAILAVVVVCMVIADVPTFYFSRHIIQRNFMDFIKNLKELKFMQKDDPPMKMQPLKLSSVIQPPYRP